MIGDNPNLAATMFEFGAQTVVDINSQKVFRDVVFSWSRRFAIGASATVDIVIDPTGASGKTLVVLPVSVIAQGAGPIFVDVYYGTDADSDGTEWIGVNRDNRSNTAALTKLRLSPTINDAGTKIPFEFMIPSDGVPATATFAGEVHDSLILIPKTDGKYMFRFVNQEADIASCLFSLTIFEATLGE